MNSSYIIKRVVETIPLTRKKGSTRIGNAHIWTVCVLSYWKEDNKIKKGHQQLGKQKNQGIGNG